MSQKCEKLHQSDPNSAVEYCASIMDYIYNVTGDVYAYDGRIFDMDDEELSAPLKGLLTTSNKLNDIFDLLHLTDSTKNPKFAFHSSVVS